MNINTKNLLASTLLTALLAGTAAYADGDRDFSVEVDYQNITDSVVVKKVNFDAPVVEAESTINSGRR